MAHFIPVGRTFQTGCFQQLIQAQGEKAGWQKTTALPDIHNVQFTTIPKHVDS